MEHLTVNSKMNELQALINGTEAEKFLNYYYGRYFTGDITLIEDGDATTLSFHKGRCVAVEDGIPNTGIDVGVQGSKAEWDKFCTHKSLSVATNKGNDLNLTTLGSPIRFRQNFNVVAQLIRVYAGIR